MADGRITIDTKIDTTGIYAGLDEIVNSIRRLARGTGELKEHVKESFSQQAKSIRESAKAYKSQENAVDGVRQRQEALNREEVPTEEYKKLEAATAETEKKIKELLDQQQRWSDAGFAPDAEAFDRTDLEVEKLRSSLKRLQQQQEEMKANGTAFINEKSAVAPGAFGNEDISETGNVVAEAAKEVGGYVSVLQASLNGLKVVVTRSIPLLVEGSLSGLKMILSGVVSGLKNTVKLAQKATLAMAQMAGSRIVGGLKKLAAGIFGIGKSTNKSTMSFDGMAKAMLKYGLGIRSLYALVNKLRSAMQEGMRNLAQYSSDTNAALSGLMSSLSQCKNALATAFDPILQVIAPALNYMISLVTAAATAVAQLIAALTGKSTFVKAVKVQKDYAKSLKGTGGAAKEAGEEAEGSLASFDKLNVMAEKNSGGGGGGGGGASAGEMFETVPVASSFKSLADTLKKFVKSQDWKGLGKYIADGFNAGLQKIYDVINWDNVGSRITYFVNAFTETFNSLVDNLDWDLLGRVIGAGVNTLVYTLNTLFDGIDWVNLGKKLGEGANGLVNEIDWHELGRLLLQKLNVTIETLYGFVKEFDWKKFGKSLGEGINGAVSSINPKMWADALSGLVKGLLDTISGALIEVDWQEIGNKIATFIKEIDYSGIFTSLTYGIGAALASLAEFLWGLVEEAWKDMVKWWEETAYEDGQFTIEGLLRGIGDKLKNIAIWIKTNIFQPFIDGFKDAFGIHSPSTIMQEMGGYLIEGLKKGIEDMIPNVIETVTGLVGRIRGLVDEALGFISELTKGDARGIMSGGAGVLAEKLHTTGTYSIYPRSEPVHLPRLASGTVVPPRAGEFAAILGDNRREAEIVSPLSTMEKAMGNVLQKYGGMGGGDINLTVNLDGRVVYQNVIKRNRMEKSRTGLNPLLV